MPLERVRIENYTGSVVFLKGLNVGGAMPENDPNGANGAQIQNRGTVAAPLLGTDADSILLGEVKAEVEKILTGVANSLQLRNTLFDMPIFDERRALRLYTEAVRMQVKLHAAPNYAAVQELRIEAVELASRSRAFFSSRALKVAVLFIGIGILGLSLIWNSDIIEMIRTALSSNQSMIYGAIGLSGFILYWIGRASQFSETMPGNIGLVLNFVVGAIAAVVVPPVIALLFFSPDGTPMEVKPSRELLSFLCGYSLKVILELLSKVIEKVNGIVKAL